MIVITPADDKSRQIVIVLSYCSVLRAIVITLYFLIEIIEVYRVIHDKLTRYISQKLVVEIFLKFDSILMSIGPIQLKDFKDGGTPNSNGSSYKHISSRIPYILLCFWIPWKKLTTLCV